jgi:hypothetical protein
LRLNFTKYGRQVRQGVVIANWYQDVSGRDGDGTRIDLGSRDQLELIELSASGSSAGDRTFSGDKRCIKGERESNSGDCRDLLRKG